MSYWFFLTYARQDKDASLVQFYEDLCREILLQLFMPRNQVGFFDGDAIRVSDPWKPALSEALCTSRLLVCLCSPAYSNSDYCGREFQVFAERQDAFNRPRAGAKDVRQTPRVIFPVLWGPPRDEFPDVIKALQYTDDEFPHDYGKEGLAYLMGRTSQADEYKKFIRTLATRLVAAGQAFQMPDLTNLRPLQEVVPSFPQRAAGAAASAVSAAAGRRYAKFVFVAARGDELKGLKNTLDGYQGGGDWQPYWPDEEDPVFVLAQEAATKLKLFFQELPLSARLEEQLRQARANNEIVIIILDAWSVQLDSYNQMIRPYDDVTSLNCALLVPWNEADPETAVARDTLRSAIQRTFSYKTKVRQGIYFQEAIPTASDLRTGLLNTMSQIRSDIINAVMASDQPANAVRSEPLARDAERRGVPLLGQPPSVQVPTDR